MPLARPASSTTVPEAPITIRSNASDAGVEAVLEQVVAGQWRPLGFFSRGLTAAVRVDSHCSPLDTPYKGPYYVIQRFTKTFYLSINGSSQFVSKDQLKPACMDPYTTSSGRPVRPPAHLSGGGG